jgi:hypothetical protein
MSDRETIDRLLTEQAQYKEALARIATFGCDIDSNRAAEVMKKFDAKAHWCLAEWDGLFIYQGCPEMRACKCR